MSVEEWQALLVSEHSYDRSHAANEPPDHAPDDVVINGLLSCLNDPDNHVRTCAADSLRNCHTDSVREGLRKHLDRETDPLTICYVLSALGDVGTTYDIPTFVKFLDSSYEPRVTLGAAEALMFCTNRVVIDHLLTLLRDNPGATRHPSVTVAGYVAEMQLEKMKSLVEMLESIIGDAKERGLKSDIENTLKSIRDKYKGV